MRWTYVWMGVGSLVLATTAAAQKRPIVSFPGLTAPVSLDTAGTAYRVPGSPARAYGELRRLFAAMKITVTVDDSVSGMLGTLRQTAIQRFANSRLSDWLNCGGGMSGPLADNARVQLAFVSMLKPAPGDSTDLRSFIVGVATSLEGSLRDPIRCNTTGILEVRVRDQLLKALAAKP
ncbi:MAG: hypothetical protein U0163_03700 [Gemmatimonadaceae bacterium]